MSGSHVPLFRENIVYLVDDDDDTDILVVVGVVIADYGRP